MVDKKSLKGVIILLTVTSIIMVLLIAGNNSLLSLLSVYIAMIIVSIVVYSIKDFRENLFGLGKNNLGKSLLFAALFAGGFWLLTRIIPGFAIGTPLVPQSIGGTIRGIVIVGFAPIIESVFFQSVSYAVLRSFLSKGFSIVGQAVLFSFAHIAAYVTGFYNYPSFAQGLDAATANISSFIAAFIFAIVGMIILVRPRINNLAFIIVFHGLLNLIILTTLVVLFG